MIEKAIEGMFEKATPGQGQVLLGTVGQHARANPGRRDHHPEIGRVHSAS